MEESWRIRRKKDENKSSSAGRTGGSRTIKKLIKTFDRRILESGSSSPNLTESVR